MTDMQQEMESRAAPSAVEQAREAIAEIEKRLVAIDERLAFNRQLRADAGLPLNGGQIQRLNDLRDESNRLDKERDDLTIWLRQAQGKEAEALRQEAVAADVALARQRLIAADNLRLGGIALDEGFSAERFEGWCTLIDALSATRLSCETSAPPPNRQQLRVFSTLAIRTMLQGVPIVAREFESVAPSQRTSFGKISADWATSAERSARAFLEGAGVALEAAE
jgi:hypothetical protein